MFKWFKKKHDFDPIPCILETGIKDEEGDEIWLTGLRCRVCGLFCNISSKNLEEGLPDELLFGCKGKKKRRK